ncbi:glycosyltransferase [Lacticaseibacillus suibinensis]|uniref:glycosyltransferase n=1 Tax=Lacticaseibacillus suibinensis TaxID=2486011 RepID=UPI001EF19CF4|nr:glycosyltransferase [Lacticaseibacillus suibinensis]
MASHLYLIVLYNQPLSHAQSYQSLVSQVDDADEVLIYDNSPVSQLDIELPGGWDYRHDATNPGLAAAYNFAVAQCVEKGIIWLTIFDQDTDVPTGFFATLKKAVVNSDATAIVPRVVMQNGTQISPFMIENGLFVLKHRQHTLAAINSGVTLNIPKLDPQPFNLKFPLDFLDYDFFKRLAQNHASIEEITPTLIQDLSLGNYREMSITRFTAFLSAEGRFVAAYYPGQMWQYRLRVFVRLIRSMLRRVQGDKLRVMARMSLKGAVD